MEEESKKGRCRNLECRAVLFFESRENGFPETKKIKETIEEIIEKVVRERKIETEGMAVKIEDIATGDLWKKVFKLTGNGELLGFVIPEIETTFGKEVFSTRGAFPVSDLPTPLA